MAEGEECGVGGGGTWWRGKRGVAEGEEGHGRRKEEGGGRHWETVNRDGKLVAEEKGGGGAVQ